MYWSGDCSSVSTYMPAKPSTPARSSRPISRTKLTDVGQCGHPLEVGPQRFDTPILDGVDGHEAGVEVADLGRFRARRRILGRAGDDLQQRLLGPVDQLAERTVGGPVGRHLERVEPMAVHVAEQVVLRPHREVELGGVDA